MTAHLRRRDPTHPEWSRTARGSSGRGLCRWCVQEVPQGRKTFCGPACIRDWQVAAGQHLHFVHQRDKGVCAACGLDTDKLTRVIADFRWLVQMECQKARTCYGDGSILPRLIDGGGYQKSTHIQHAEATITALGYPVGFSTIRSLWEADHLVPLAEGGQNHLDNLRTLCVPCHRKETRALAARLAKSRRKAKEDAKVAQLLAIATPCGVTT